MADISWPGGNLFVASTGVIFLSAGTPVLGAAIFNPATSKRTILVYRINWVFGSGAVIVNLGAVTADPAYANAITPTNQNIGSALPSVLAGHCSYINAAQSTPNTFLQFAYANAGNMSELLQGGDTKLLQPGEGLLVSVLASGASNWGVSFFWRE